MARRWIAGRTGRLVRFVVSGGVVACISLSLTAGLTYAGLAFQIALIVSFATGITVQFLLHRHFTFAGGDGYALGTGQQMWRFVAIAVAQYATIAGGVAVLAPLLVLPELVVYLGVVAVLAVANFLVLSARVFHAHEPLLAAAPDENERVADDQRLAREDSSVHAYGR